MIRHRPSHPKNPLPRISPAHATVPGYRYALPTGADNLPHPTANYSLLTGHPLAHSITT